MKIESGLASSACPSFALLRILNFKLSLGGTACLVVGGGGVFPVSAFSVCSAFPPFLRPCGSDDVDKVAAMLSLATRMMHSQIASTFTGLILCNMISHTFRSYYFPEPELLCNASCMPGSFAETAQRNPKNDFSTGSPLVCRYPGP